MAANWTAFVASQILTASQLNGVVDNFQDIAIFNETQASGTNGGTFTLGSFVKRTLNTTVVNNITGCSIASSVVTLPAGTYRIRGNSPAFQVGSHKNRFQNTTDSTTAIDGSSEFVSNTIGTQSVFDTVITIAATKNFELQHRGQFTVSSNGLGAACGFSVSEIYSTLFIQRVQ
jgi:hypothetical protein